MTTTVLHRGCNVCAKRRQPCLDPNVSFEPPHHLAPVCPSVLLSRLSTSFLLQSPCGPPEAWAVPRPKSVQDFAVPSP